MMTETPLSGVNTEIQNLLMEIIAYSGDGHGDSLRAVDEALKDNPKRSKELLDQAQVKINKAHKAQTKLLQMEANGKEINQSVLLIHAQNHLMNSMLTSELSEKLIQIFQTLKENN